MTRLLLSFTLLAAAGFAQPGFDASLIDKNLNPCQDFYQYACHVWMDRNPIPADQSRWSRFEVLREYNRAVLRDILERAAKPSPDRDPIDRQIGDYYAACMDEPAVNAKGAKPLEPELEAIGKIASIQDLPAALARLHRIGVGAMFRFGSEPDFKNATLMIASMDQGGLGLPDRDYYFRDDEKSKTLRDEYRRHVGAMFRLLGDNEETATRNAQTVFEMETALANGSLDRVSRRDPNNVYHKMSVAELARLAPSFDWKAYFEALSTPAFDSLNVSVPNFVETLEKQLDARSLDDWKVYLSWHLLRASAPLLSAPFVEENFAFYGKTLQGVEEQRPRWKRCTDLVDGELGEALGRKYVQEKFPPESRKRMLDLVAALEKALEADIRQVPWMTEPTRQKALAKLHAIRNKIGYPDRWRDYSSVRVTRDDALGNSMRASRFEVAYQLRKINQDVDRNEWEMTPPTVNAYYQPLHNNINFPAGILQPPFFDPKMDDAVNFGGIGAVIGHELTHGFDDQGRQFDADGNLEDWWTPADAAEFEKRAQCFVDQYSAYTATDDVKLNGKLTLGENTADNGGLRIAFMALMNVLDDHTPEKIDGFTAQQRLFLGWSQVWCENIRDEAARMRALTDPHSLGRYRVNGVVSNMPEFQQAFGCKAGDPMVRAPQCRVW